MERLRPRADAGRDAALDGGAAASGGPAAPSRWTCAICSCKRRGQTPDGGWKRAADRCCEPTHEAARRDEATMIRLSSIAALLRGHRSRRSVTTCSRGRHPQRRQHCQPRHYVDEQHVALSRQFFNKTTRNVLENPRAQVTRLGSGELRRLRAASCATCAPRPPGPLFDGCRCASRPSPSHTGMSGIFRLLAADVFEVLGRRAGHRAPAGRPIRAGDAADREPGAAAEPPAAVPPEAARGAVGPAADLRRA